INGDLPDGGPRRYRGLLQLTCYFVQQQLDNPVLTADDITTLEHNRRHLCDIARDWDRLEAVCEGAPRTLVHGDFNAKNLRLKSENGHTRVVVFDWEAAGWGVPAADLAQAAQFSRLSASPDIGTYWSVIRERCPDTRADGPARLAAYGLPDALSLFSMSGGTVPADVAQGCLDLDAAAAAGVLLNTWHSLPAHVVRRFRQKIFVDTDPGLVQVLMTTGDIHLAPHDAYFTIGETVGTPAARFPDCGLHWHYTPTPVFLPAWPVVTADAAAPYTTVTHRRAGAVQVRGEPS